MDNWNEIKSAYKVAKLGTLTAAAKDLNVHRATVLRHIDDLERSVGMKLFQRHSKGYTPTEAGLDLLKIADVTNDQFTQLFVRMKNSSAELTGDLIITSVEIMATMLMPAMSAFQEKYPKTTVRFLSSEKVLKLEYGDAHIAIRGGAKPTNPDNVIIPFMKVPFGLYAHQSYIDRKGEIGTDFSQHEFACFGSQILALPYHDWVKQHVDPNNIKFLSNSPEVLKGAINSGRAMGFLPQYIAEKYSGLREIIAPHEDWDVNFWLITHGDLHRSPKVQAFLKILKRTENQTADLQKLSLFK
jgi:DNA-binding transcriptional LysR family regulator